MLDGTPWDELAALDLATGKPRWPVPLGVLDTLVRLPLPLRWGTPRRCPRP